MRADDDSPIVVTEFATLLRMDERTTVKIPHSFFRAIVIGGFNTLVSAALLNLFVFVTGVARGPLVIIFSLASFVIVLAQSYLWNRFWVFRHNPTQKTHVQFGAFAMVAIMAVIVSTSILHLVVNVIGAPPGIAPRLWVNVAILVSLPFSFSCGYFGNRFFVFRKDRQKETPTL